MKTITFFWILYILFGLGLIGVIIWNHYDNIKYRENQCLNNTATDYCNSLSKQFIRIDYHAFTCKNERETMGTSYRFTEDELNNCLKGG